MSSEYATLPKALHPRLGYDNEKALEDIDGFDDLHPGFIPSKEARTGRAPKPPIMCWGYPFSFEKMENYALDNGFEGVLTGEADEEEDLQDAECTLARRHGMHRGRREYSGREGCERCRRR
ncbi:hypothetical protein SERLA73DRAFT_189303 [Serpula lacrymans var. lacrymans S7.3]|uniref:Uncharacterized protein n=2 Tax=Serpula lacrymans var. lacrymans TaxID=341189 RepID=F8QDB8_SERL3|nr:uncharacterized protein SERLADRAFT_480053 [Serpula lacrymans var. lacrymans S7.9]EGN93589.1 hypothetical protein SERLA73DRAFT_189303 [Serpula lacrymans var. lacrymans S7.3]EGO18961.1 hypothetical protein SERLADRAFT_480053 [Serpula lacrymans var. lacrymans S7.9]